MINTPSAESVVREFWRLMATNEFRSVGQVLAPGFVMLDDLKVLANQRDVPYQSLLKVYLAERVAVERDAATRPSRRASA